MTRLRARSRTKIRRKSIVVSKLVVAWEGAMMTVMEARGYTTAPATCYLFCTCWRRRWSDGVNSMGDMGQRATCRLPCRRYQPVGIDAWA